jgi:adenosylcobinamide-GDP ribazoletransferase
MAQSARSFVLALQYFTRVPIPAALARWTGYSSELQRASLAHFPGVGILVALAAFACYWASAQLLPGSPLAALVAAVLSTMATLALTGALHEDGLADTADGLAGSAERERALEIMKDSRIGRIGALALMLVLLMKIGLLTLVGSAGGLPAVAAALLGAHAVSRGLTLVIVATLPNIGQPATSKSLGVAQRIGWPSVAVAALWCLPPLLLAVALTSVAFAVAACAAAVGTLLWMRHVFVRRLQGFTGDCLGASQQYCECAFYLGAALALGVA